MTVSSTSIVTGPYTGNNTADTYSYAFKITAESEIEVYETTDLGVETLLTLTVDYTVTGVGDSGGGTIVRVAGNLPTNYEWYMRSNRPYTQLSALDSQGGFFPDVHEDALDKLTILHQQDKDRSDRALRVADSDDISGSNLTLPNAASRAGTVLAFNETTGDPEVGPDIASVGTVAANVADINTVAADLDGADTIGTNATNIADINTNATNIADINAVAADIADVSTVAANIVDVNTTATNIVDVNSFAKTWQGAFATNPTVRTSGGGALLTGDLYLNTTVDEMRSYTGAAWVAAAASPSSNPFDYKGTWDATTALPAGDAGFWYRVSVASTAPIIFANGSQDVQTFDTVICNTNGTAANTPANWDVMQGNLELASQAEAEAGTDNAKFMTPLRVLESAAANLQAPAALSVTAAKLATDAVETLKIKDANVTDAKLASLAATPGSGYVEFAGMLIQWGLIARSFTGATDSVGVQSFPTAFKSGTVPSVSYDILGFSNPHWFTYGSLTVTATQFNPQGKSIPATSYTLAHDLHWMAIGEAP